MIKNRTALIGSNSTIEKEGKIRRSCIGKDCTIGKNVEIENSIILDGTVIMEGYLFSYVDQKLSNRL